MSSLAQQTGLPIQELISVVVAAGIALAVLSRLRVFRPIVETGPDRLGPGETPFSLALLLGIALFGGGILAYLVSRILPPEVQNDRIKMSAVIWTSIFAGLLTVNIAIRRDGIMRIGLRPTRIVSGVPWGAIGLILTVPIVFASAALVTLLLRYMGVPDPAPHEILQQLKQDGTRSTHVWLIISAVILAPLVEETLFRGFVQTIIGRASASPWVGILYTSIVFAWVHAEAAYTLPLCALSVGLGYLYERTGNLWAPIVMHGLFNAFQIAFFLREKITN